MDAGSQCLQSSQDLKIHSEKLLWKHCFWNFEHADTNIKLLQYYYIIVITPNVVTGETIPK